MRRINIIHILLLIMLVSTCTGCGRSTRNSAAGGTTLRYPIVIEPATFDPARINDVYTSELMQNIYEGLVTLDANNAVIPALARTWETSSDGKTYTFHLDPGAKFHNGRPVTSDDVKYSFERALWKETQSQTAANYLGAIIGVADVVAGKTRTIAGVKVIDPHTLAITIDKPRGYFLGMLSYPTGWAVCKEAIEKNGGRLDDKAAIGCGPFALKDYRHGAKVTMEAFSGYHGGKPLLSGIERPIVLDYQTAHIQYENNEVDFCFTALNDYVNDAKSPTLKDQTLLRPYASVNYIVMHPGLQPVFKKSKVRQAIAMAIDREDIVRHAAHGIWQKAEGFLPPGLAGYDTKTRGSVYDPVQARQLLAEAGYPDGKGFPRLTLVYVEKQPEVADSASIVRDNLKQNLGITIDLQEREAGTFFEDTGTKERIPFWMAGWIADYPDPQDFLSTLLRTKAPLNHVGYSNAQFDALCDQADAEADMNKRIPFYQQADQIATSEVAVLPLYYLKQQFLQKPYVKDLAVNIMQPIPHYKTRIVR